MATPQEALDTMLDDFETAHKTASDNPGKNFRDLIENTPQLKADMLESIRKGNLDTLEAIDGTSPLGYYNADNKALAVSLDQLNDASTRTQTANSIRFTLGHEIQHGVNRQDILDQDKALRGQAHATAKTPSPHDYTAELKSYNATSRQIETTAEIAGFNTLASYVTAKNPHATLNTLYDASPDDMKMYIKADLSHAPPTYTARPGLTIGADLKIASTAANVETMGKLFYDANGYPPRETGRAVGMIREEESKALVEAHKLHPGQAAPEIRVDMNALGLPGMALPRGFTDSSHPRLQAQPDAAAPLASDPRQPGNPDNDYFRALRDKLPPSVPDNAVAHAMLLAKKDGMGDVASVNLDQVRLSNNTIWIGGNTPGFRVGVDPTVAPPMEQVSRDLQAHAQGPGHEPARAQTQDAPQPAAMAR